MPPVGPTATKARPTRMAPVTASHPCRLPAKSGPQRARDVLGSETSTALWPRVRIVQLNVGVRSQALSSAAALADASNGVSGDLIATDQVFPDRVGEIYHLIHNAGQRWSRAGDDPQRGSAIKAGTARRCRA